jgi:hypothetical protein
MKKLGRLLGTVLLYGAGLLMFIFWVGAMGKWLGTLGIILAIIIAPGAIIFPAAYWIIEGVFPTLYFALWGIGLLGLFIGGISSKDD